MRTLNYFKLFSLLLALPLLGQMEPQLKTVTDIQDVYQSVSGKAKLVSVYDFGPHARAIFEPRDYLTIGGRTAFLFNTGQAAGDTDEPLMNTILTSDATGQGKSYKDLKNTGDFGFVFALKKNGTTAEVRLVRWPKTNRILTDPNNGNAHIVGIPYNFASDGTKTLVTWDGADDAAGANAVIRSTTHVRFSLIRTPATTKAGRPVAAVVRTIDLPCPSQIWDSPDTAPARNFQKGILTGTVSDGTAYTVDIDPWSKSNPSYGTITASDTNTYHLMGQFHYTVDYLAWIFGGTKIRFTDSDGTEYRAATYGYKAGDGTNQYAVPSSVTPDTLSTDKPLDDGKEGWANGLPNMTRFQSMKSATVKIFLDPLFYKKIQFAYRYLDGAYGDAGEAVEEANTAWITSAPARDADPDANLTNRDTRLLTLPKLNLKTTALQNKGPVRMDYIANASFTAKSSGTPNMSAYDVDSPDPRAPEPISWALGNTYRQLWKNEGSLFETATCTKSFVVLFPTQGSNDSKTGAFDQLAQDDYKLYMQGGGENSGSYTSTINYNDLKPGTIPPTVGADPKRFAPAGLASVAAHGVKAEVDTWKAPWHGATETGIQTMIISTGIPGTYLWKGGNSNKSVPHEKLFQTAQVGNPNRNTWANINGGSPDKSKLDGGEVFYYIGASPKDVEDAFKSAASEIVSASAALSAPATPATGIRVTTQGFFGTFKTTKKLLWWGNLYSVGIRRDYTKVDPNDATKTLFDKFSFYGAGGQDVNGNCTPDPAAGVICVPNFDLYHLWSAYDIFGTYTAADKLVRGYNPQTTGVLGDPLSWSSRTMKTVVGTAVEPWPTGTETSAAAGSALAAIIAKVKEADGTTAITLDKAKNLVRWVRGAYNVAAPTNTTNRIDIMGDIVNSAPLTIELGYDRLPTVLKTQWDDYSTAGKTDIHGRLIIMGTNVGQIHCFGEVSASNSKDGSGNPLKDAANVPYSIVESKATELWSFIPPEFWQSLYDLYRNKNVDAVDGGAEHLYMCDGDPVFYTDDKPPSDATKGTLPDSRLSLGENGVVIFGFRKGARSYYALQISKDPTDTDITPLTPKLIWKLDPLDPTNTPGTAYTDGSGETVDVQGLLKTAGMATSVPAIAKILVKPTDETYSKQDAVFISGGYSNEQMDAQYKSTNATTYAKGMGKFILALNPLTGAALKTWDFRDVTGAIVEGVTPLRVFQGDLVQRLYFADMKGDVWALNGGRATNDKYLSDTSVLAEWITTPRPIYKSSLETATNDRLRFTTRPDAARLTGGFPVANADSVRPLTVMVAIGSGDRNNPTDKLESYSIRKPATDPPEAKKWWRTSDSSWVTQEDAYLNPKSPTYQNRFFVFADRQDSKALDLDVDGIPRATKLQLIDSSWPNSYYDTATPPGPNSKVTPGGSDYLFKSNYGYYWDLPRQASGSLSSADGTITRDKLMVSPLVKEGVVYFSVFNIANNATAECGPNNITRTFRECFILRPLRLDLSTTATRSAADFSSFSTPTDSCTGLAFFFNSLSSPLVDAGLEVIQGGSRSDQSTQAYSSQTGAARPTLERDAFPFSKKGMRIRAWRVVR